ncbi:MAG: hypothetical protein J7480_08210, partial [Microbacteriaceae bacterium]|nr:hypothetical protein [Microbacteriaceae bacterium]
YDHWLKGVDTGIMDEPPVRLLVRGGPGFRDEHEWPLARTEWTELHLGPGLGLTESPPTETGVTSFRNDPLLGVGVAGPGLRFQTDQLADGVEVTGPVSVHL